MPKYIEANWLLDKAVPHGWSTPKWVSDIVIEDAPTADLVEVVRCKDCKHRYIENVVWVCPFGLPCSEFFCSYGERKEAEDGRNN